MSTPSALTTCPVPPPKGDDRILLAHGEGGRLMRKLIAERILPRVGGAYLRDQPDAAVLPRCQGLPVLTTDSFVVSPLFFPGGDIGTLSVFGTVNDLVVAGARPLWISLSLILEEGLPVSTLDAVLQSIADSAAKAGVQVVTGDTKVVPRHAADGMFITTTGLGELIEPAPPGAHALENGDAILVTGPIGRHGIAVLVARENLEFDPPPASDCAPLWDAAEILRAGGCPVRTMRDATRGGVAAVLHEWAEASGRSILIDEAAIPVSQPVRGACELLGLDPLHLPNEGTMVVAVPPDWAERAREAMRQTPQYADTEMIGHVEGDGPAGVLVRRGFAPEIPLDEPHGAPLPRIC